MKHCGLVANRVLHCVEKYYEDLGKYKGDIKKDKCRNGLFFPHSFVLFFYLHQGRFVLFQQEKKLLVISVNFKRENKEQ